jgi:hypothetical protein
MPQSKRLFYYPQTGFFHYKDGKRQERLLTLNFGMKGVLKKDKQFSTEQITNSYYNLLRPRFNFIKLLGAYLGT